MDRNILAVVLWGQVFLGCPKYPVPDPPPGPYPKGATCESACAHLQSLECAFAQPTPAGVQCTELCSESIPPWNVDCMTAASECSEADGCPDLPANP